MRVSATAKYLRGSTRKANLVVAAIKGRPVEEAAALLKFMPQHAAHDVAGGAEERHGQRREQPQPVRRGPDRRRCPGQRGPDDQALAAAGPGSGVPDPQAHDPHHDRRRGPGGLDMGSKVHPYGFRLGVSRTWTAKWYADKEYTALLKEDIGIRQLVERRLANASVSRRRDRAGHQPRHGHDPHGQARDRHRQGRRQRRGPPPADRRPHEAPGQAGDQGDPPAGARRPPRGDEHRRPAVPPDRLQEGDEAGDPALDEGRRQGRPDRRRRPPRRLRDGSPRVGPRRSDPARHAPRRHQLRPDPRPHDLRPDRRQGLDLPRRHRPGADAAARAPAAARPPSAGEPDRC